jgi:hypothetical protein
MAAGKIGDREKWRGVGVSKGISMSVISGGVLHISSHKRHSSLELDLRSYSEGLDDLDLHVGFSLPSHEARRLYHLLHELYDPRYDGGLEKLES